MTRHPHKRFFGPSASAFDLALTLALVFALPVFPASVPTSVHPNWKKFDLRPEGFKPQVSGMAFQSDGKLLIADWNSSRALAVRVGDSQPRTYNGRVFLLSGVTGTQPAVTIDTLATGLEDVMGMTLVKDTIYVSGGNAILRLTRAGGLAGPVTRRDTIFFLPGTPVNGDSLNPARGSQEYLFGLLHRDGKFYVAASSQDVSGSGTQQSNPYRGSLLEITPGNGTTDKRGSFRILANGLRVPSGMSFGPDSAICVSDNQGEWLPSSKLICVKPGRYYGARKSRGANDYYAPWDALTETPPTAWVVHTDIGNSPTQPVVAAPHTPYAGQMLMGDVRWGTGINRYFVERNGDEELQGAIFVFTGGLEAGAFRMAWGPDSMLYVGMIGGRDDADGYPNNLSTRVDYGLQKLQYTGGDTAFEMRAVRSRPGGLEIEFTRAVDSTVASATASYTVQSYHMTPSSGYGSGSKQGSTQLVPTGIQISPDHRKVYLALSGIVPSTPTQMRVVYLRLNGYKSATQGNLWSTEAWYTLNAFGTGTPFDLPVALEPPRVKTPSSDLRWIVRAGELRVRVPENGSVTRVRLRSLSGALLTELQNTGSGEYALPLRAAPAGFAVLEGTGPGVSIRRLIDLR